MQYSDRRVEQASVHGSPACRTVFGVVCLYRNVHFIMLRKIYYGAVGQLGYRYRGIELGEMCIRDRFKGPPRTSCQNDWEKIEETKNWFKFLRQCRQRNRKQRISEQVETDNCQELRIGVSEEEEEKEMKHNNIKVICLV